VPASDTASTLGAAMLAGVGAGLYRDFPDAVAQTVHIERVHEPDEARHRLYQQYFELYRDLYEQTKGTMERLDKLSSAKELP
jgi:xylulokinase